jgi:hypothetical protein
MADSGDAQPAQMPTPDPALKRLDRLVGTWSMKGRLVGSEEENIVGQTTFQWLEAASFCNRTWSSTSRA